MEDQPIFPQWGASSGEQTEETVPNPLKSNPVRSEGKEYNIGALEQEIETDLNKYC